MKKSIFWAFIASFAACVAHAEGVTPAMALVAADAWAERNAQFETGNNATNVITVCDPDDAQIVLWHQVSMAGGGCLIIAPVTEIEPVVTALDNDPGELPDAHPLRGILTYDMRCRLRFLNLYGGNRPRLRLGATASGAQEQEEDEEAAAQKEAVRQEWAEQQQTKWDRLIPNRTGRPQRLGASQKARADDSQMQVMVVLPGFQQGGPLTHWNQSDGIYNYYTPGNVVCGCVATAAAAMMQYFRVGEKPGQEIKAGQADAGTTYLGARYSSSTKGGKYDWASLPKSYGGDRDGALTEENRQLLGRVTYDAGVAVGMGWNPGGSGASEAATATAFKNYFGFKEVRSVSSPKPDQYAKVIYAQVRAGAPVGMGIGRSAGGSGHSVVAVGYGIDEDDVERVRVFLGWGGSGDGWYALPYINTKATYDGQEDLYDLVHDVITMIGYENDNVVPVYGRFIPYINPDMTIGGTEVKADGFINTNGFFGARVSASATKENREVEITCMGKSYISLVGPYASCSDSRASDAAAICKWVPDPIMFPLLNSEVALSFADARQKCIDSITNDPPKPVLAFSGSWGKPATDSAWDYLYWLDTNTVDGVAQDFTNKYIILCVPYSLGLSSESDGNPSIGIFDGRSISDEANKVWSFYNGRIAHWSIGSSIFTNVENQVEDNIREFYITNSVDGVGYIVTNKVEDLPSDTLFELNDRVPATYVTGWGITNALITVMAEGLTNFLERASGISLRVAHNCPENPGHADPDYGLYENLYTNGVTITATTPEFATNKAGNVEFRCVGYLLSTTNEPDIVETNLNTTTAQFTPMPNGAYTLTWLWETNKVKITTEITSRNNASGTIMPGTGWYNFNDVVTFFAIGDTDTSNVNHFFGWVPGDPDKNLTINEDYSESGNMLVVTVTRPITLNAEFDKTRKTRMGTFNLKVTNYGTKDGDSVPATLVDRTELPYGETTNLCLKTTDVVLSVNGYTDVDGIDQMCLGWMLTGEDGKMLYKLYFDGSLVCIPTNFVDACNGVNGGGLFINGNDVLEIVGEGAKTNEVNELDGSWVYYPSYTSPLSLVGINPGFYGITNGATATLTWLWQLPPDADDITNVVEITWNDTLDNLFDGYTTNLFTSMEMTSKGWGIGDISVTAPTGWVPRVEIDDSGNVVAKLSLDEAALSAALENCALTIYPKDDGSGAYAVEATIDRALRGFLYVLVVSDDLATWNVAVSDPGLAATGTSGVQAQGTAEAPVTTVDLSVTVKPSTTDPSRFYKVISGDSSIFTP